MMLCIFITRFSSPCCSLFHPPTSFIQVRRERWAKRYMERIISLSRMPEFKSASSAFCKCDWQAIHQLSHWIFSAKLLM